jgi:RND family efflux transporter MFP subunit
MDERESTKPPTKDPELEVLYAQLAQSATRLMVVHEASNILRSTLDAGKLARGLLGTIAEAAFAASGCVVDLKAEEPRVLATSGLEDEEIHKLAADQKERAVWSEVARSPKPRIRTELKEALDRGTADQGGSAEGGSGGTSVSAEQEAAGFWAPIFELYVPLRVEDEVLGVLALGPRVDGRPFGGDDMRLAESLCSHLGLGLNHAALFAERNQRIEQLSVLLKISREITSTLDLERVLNTIAQMMNLVLPNRRTNGGRVSIRANSDTTSTLKEAGADPLLPLLQWARGAHQTINTCQYRMESEPDADGRDVILPWLKAEGGPRGLAIVPLEDEQGLVGLLSIETDEDAPPLDDDREELITILSNQTTVAIRNAELYEQIPMIGVFEPLLAKIRRAHLARSRKAMLRAGVVVAILALGAFLPVPAWVSGGAKVRPAAPVALRAATDGTIEEIHVVEGQEVTEGTVVARMKQDELLVQIEQVDAAEQRVTAEASRARVQGDLATYRAQQAKLNELFETKRFLEEELRRTNLTAHTDGTVLTPKVEQRRGEYLARGETFVELGNFTLMQIEVFVSEHDVHAIDVGRPARVKVHAYPNRTFYGEVYRISPKSTPDGRFRVTVLQGNKDRALRPGMTGRAHLEIANRPLLLSVFRPVIRWFRLRFWV